MCTVAWSMSFRILPSYAVVVPQLPHKGGCSGMQMPCTRRCGNKTRRNSCSMFRRRRTCMHSKYSELLLDRYVLTNVMDVLPRNLVWYCGICTKEIDDENEDSSDSCLTFISRVPTYICILLKFPKVKEWSSRHCRASTITSRPSTVILFFSFCIHEHLSQSYEHVILL